MTSSFISTEVGCLLIPQRKITNTKSATSANSAMFYRVLIFNKYHRLMDRAMTADARLDLK